MICSVVLYCLGLRFDLVSSCFLFGSFRVVLFCVGVDCSASFCFVLYCMVVFYIPYLCVGLSCIVNCSSVLWCTACLGSCRFVL